MESPEYLPQERDLEADKTTFIEAVKDAKISTIETEFDEPAAIDLENSLKKAKLFLLGEIHSVKENPDIVYTLFKKFGFKNLAIEWEPPLKNEVENFLKTGELDFNVIKDSPDGRITAGHFALFKKLKDEGQLEKLVCFDREGASNWDQRDENMAEDILENLNEDYTLVIAGNLHTKVKPIDFGDGEGEHHPMGENIRKEIPSAPSGKIKYLAGQFHNYGTRDFEEKSDGIKTFPARFYKSDDGLYVFELPEAHVATVPHSSEVLE
jgi:hypothetical protein